MTSKETVQESLPAIWGGMECTINRVGNDFIDQLDTNDYYNKPEYLDAVISLGIKTLRFPVLWEKHQPVDGEPVDWSFTTTQLEKLRTNGIEPIAGLLHHGSGPSFTDLLQTDFPERFASYAAEVAAQFPWINYYTPVNEPLTTARFSGLYGLWYPHKKNDVSFIKILLNELKATVLAMQAIRKINPAAKLVQTEDLGKTYSTPLLSYQAVFENHRRWLTYDILTGKFSKGHPLWNYFMRLGIKRSTLTFFTDNPCTPDILGVNHYLTSERYLDEHIQNYPSHTHGSNTLHEYADVEAVRVDIKEPHGAEYLLRELWERYGISIAVTEVHLRCSREEQLRWLQHVYKTAVKLRKENVDIVAITPWSLLGSYGWNKLLTSFPLEYESGAFDISAGYARPTAVAGFIKSLAGQTPSTVHLTDSDGWWKRSTRFFHGATNDSCPIKTYRQPLIIIGKNGTLGKAFSRACKERNIYHLLLGREEADICSSAMLEKMITRYCPWGIINAAGYVNVDGAETESGRCNMINAVGPQNLALVCKKYSIKLMCFSSDLVFDGGKNAPYVESDTPNALNVYGRSKMFAEEFVNNINSSALMIRTSGFFSPYDNYNFITKTLFQLDSGKTLHIPDDIVISPTYVPHLVHAGLDLFIDDEKGIVHLANKGGLSWYRFAVQAAWQAGMDENKIIPIRNAGRIAPQPAYSVLASEKYNLMPTLEEGLNDYFTHIRLSVNI
jgi:dTDP-4-dehydrorhamnose reductase